MENLDILKKVLDYLIEQDGENAFDILLDEFSSKATRGELTRALFLLENTVLDYKHR